MEENKLPPQLQTPYPNLNKGMFKVGDRIKKGEVYGKVTRVEQMKRIDDEYISYTLDDGREESIRLGQSLKYKVIEKVEE